MIKILETVVGEAAVTPGSGPSTFMPLIMVVAMFVIMYFFLIRPQMKQQKEHANMLSSLKKGDRVITSGGIWGVVVGISDAENIVVIRIDENTKVEVAKAYVVGVKKEGAAALPAQPK